LFFFLFFLPMCGKDNRIMKEKKKKKKNKKGGGGGLESCLAFRQIWYY